MIKLYPLRNTGGLPTATHAAERSERTAHLFPDAAAALPIRADISEGAQAGVTLTGPVQQAHAPANRDVVISAEATGAGFLIIEDSLSEHGGFREAARFAIPASVTYGLRFTPCWGWYRISWFAGHAASRVLIVSQLVDPVNAAA